MRAGRVLHKKAEGGSRYGNEHYSNFGRPQRGPAVASIGGASDAADRL